MAEAAGVCPVCRKLITKETGWHNHHIQWRVYGGSDDLDNRLLNVNHSTRARISRKTGRVVFPTLSPADSRCSLLRIRPG